MLLLQPSLTSDLRPLVLSTSPAQMVFPKINHGFLSADQQLIKRRLIKVVVACVLCSSSLPFLHLNRISPRSADDLSPALAVPTLACMQAS